MAIRTLYIPRLEDPPFYPVLGKLPFGLLGSGAHECFVGFGRMLFLKDSLVKPLNRFKQFSMKSIQHHLVIKGFQARVSSGFPAKPFFLFFHPRFLIQLVILKRMLFSSHRLLGIVVG